MKCKLIKKRNIRPQLNVKNAHTKYFHSLKDSYVVAKMDIILCIWCNAICLCGLRLKNIFHISYIIVPLCIIFYKAHWPDQVHCDCEYLCVTKILRPLLYLKTQQWQQYYIEIKSNAFFLSYTLGLCYQIVPHCDIFMGVCLNEAFYEGVYES